MTATTDRVKSIAAAKPATVTGTDCRSGGQKVLLAAGRLAGFHACYGACEPVDGGISLDPEAAELLGVGVGDEVWTVAR
jgi:arginine N-succinyltransferase